MPLFRSIASFSVGTKSSTRDLIIQILSDQWPLSAKQVFAAVKKQSETGISYQAVHKSIMDLKQDGVVREVGKKFVLNLDWIKQVKGFGERLEKAYVSSVSSKEVGEDAAVRNYRFNDAMSLARFILDDFFSLSNLENKPSVCWWWNMYPTFSISDAEYRRMREKLAKTKFYMLGGTDTPMDKIFAENFEKLGVKIKVGVEIPFNPDTMVCGDYVGLIYFSPKFRRMWHKYCKIGAVLNKLKMGKLLMLLYEHCDSFNVVVTKNPEIADRIRGQTLEHFKKGGK
jgi:hypothetical protein